MKSILGLLLLLAVLLPAKIWRAAQESSTWIDETHTLVLATQDYPLMLDHSVRDAHPPAFYFALNRWLAFGKALGFEPGILWARSLNVIAWCFFAAGCWFGGRALLGVWGGTLMAWVLASGAQTAQVAKTLKGYGFAAPAVFGCFLILAILSRNDGATRFRRPKALAFWAAYAILGSLALWTHGLTGIVLALLGTWWLVLATRRGLRSSFFLFGAIAHIAILASFIPWFAVIPGYVEVVSKEPPIDWRTPRTVANLFRVFTFWYPCGEIAVPEGPLGLFEQALGAASFLLPLAAGMAAFLLPSRRRVPPHIAWCGLAGLAVTVANVAFLWTIHRLGIATTFHGARYPVFTAPVWAAALAIFAVAAARLFGERPAAAWALMAPWFLASALGQYHVMRDEGKGGLIEWMESSPSFPPRDKPLYVIQPELVPFHRKALASCRIRPADDLAHADPSTSDPVVLNLNWWIGSGALRDLLAVTLIENGVLSGGVERIDVADGGYNFFRLLDFRRDNASRLLRNGFAPLLRDFPPQAIAVARHEEMSCFDGWSGVSPSLTLETRRWGIAPESGIRFDRSLPPGSYTVHLFGARSQFPTSEATMTLQFRDEPEIAVIQQPAGPFTIMLPVKLTRRHRSPVLTVRHPSWRPLDFAISEDNRPLTFEFTHAWVERADAASSPTAEASPAAR